MTKNDDCVTKRSVSRPDNKTKWKRESEKNQLTGRNCWTSDIWMLLILKWNARSQTRRLVSINQCSRIPGSMQPLLHKTV
uniref:Uncharacterized protein n=1 Tax=Caenorhabditis tropicalis TaxID=1561998 RepID=A0A1I7ULX0_9PELO